MFRTTFIQFSDILILNIKQNIKQPIPKRVCMKFLICVDVMTYLKTPHVHLVLPFSRLPAYHLNGMILSPGLKYLQKMIYINT